MSGDRLDHRTVGVRGDTAILRRRFSSVSLLRRAARRDSNESLIVDALRSVGCSVQRLSEPGVPDLLVGKAGINYLIEVKRHGAETDLSVAQIEWHLAWRGKVSVVATVKEALFCVGAVHELSLTPQEKAVRPGRKAR